MKNIFFIAFIVFHFLVKSQNTVGLITIEDGNADGYVLFSPMSSTKTYLINKCGEKIHEWNTSTNRPALSCHLMEDGSLLRTGKIGNVNFDEGGNGGIIEKFDWEGNLTWTYTISGVNFVQHHDIKLLPNGNILAIVWDRYTAAEAIEMGKNTSYSNSHLWSEKIIEIQPIGTNDATIVWEWKVWDHLVQDFDNTKPNFGIVADSPQLMNINYFPGQPTNVDWIHLNSIDYNPITDQILVSSHTLNEIWIIDHSTSTSEAASHTGGNSGKGGDILYRWGNPQSYGRGNPTTKVFYGQHHATWIPPGFPNEGKIIVFNNGLNRPGTFSSIDMIEPPINSSNLYEIEGTSAFLPTNLFWSYTDPVPSNFYSSNISGVYPMPNGSFIITSGANGTFFEINNNEEIIWKYINPIVQEGPLTQGAIPGTTNPVFRCVFYPSLYPAFTGKTLTPLGEIELNPIEPSLCQIASFSIDEDVFNKTTIYPNPFQDVLIIDQLQEEEFEVKLTDAYGRIVFQIQNSKELKLSELSSGMYTLSISSTKGTIKVFKLVK